jgi:hypothetical protein
MKYKIVYLPMVFEDIKESKFFYNSRKKGLGNEYISNVKSELKIIQKNPMFFEIKYNNTRIAFVDKFPVGIHFEIRENTNVIVVKSVLHTSRNPDDWKNT